MAANGWGTDFGKLVEYYFNRLISATQDITQQKMQYIVWQEGTVQELELLPNSKINLNQLINT